MEKRALILIFVVVSVLLILGVYVLLPQPQKATVLEYAPNEVIVQFKPEVAQNDALMKCISSSVHAEIGATVKREFKELPGMQLVTLPDGTTVSEATAFYSQNQFVQNAEPNYIAYATRMPNDKYFSLEWGLHNTGSAGRSPATIGVDIRAPKAWDTDIGSRSVIVAVADSGVDYTHPDLVGNIWTNPNPDPYKNDVHGWNFVDDNNDPMDYCMHGTHVAGTIAAIGNNGIGVTGVMWTAQIMPVRWLDADGRGNTADEISAINYASAMGAQIINISAGGRGYSQALKNAIDASPALIVCAAGNDGTNDDQTFFYPASYASNNLITVAATDYNDNLASFSNYGVRSVHVAAPGVNIASTIPLWKTRAGYDPYDFLSGTSMAAPHVSGVAGLIKAKHPEYSNLQLKAAVLNSVDYRSSLNGLILTSGRIDALKAVSS